ncbi:c-type cytochrome biogenesis protein CcmF [Polynucleobacter sp. SHI8]|uniref:heme lyase CcmF/NrfE family subunit n=1 Tax=unclassified Polynucleobacter TaxID=2640945 RepID=UPI0024901936|nr:MULTISPECIES: heme lyase CcmF/NrfE family subunit [unclassified Polynucleobacter]BDW11722.1 c-type cytochrome biogenesis protein CcmF [Polynucleobacter sp. SHI2]BDW14169.1 c-type cytochrome biogenesis protein CcmF [Polynucleobacter sp. SHI8]
MIPEIGHIALITAFVVALLQCVLPLWGAHTHQVRLMAIAKPAAFAHFVMILVAFACLIYAFMNNDFSVLNVAENSNASLPMIYRICASWGSHEGSILLWALMLSGWGLAVACFSKNLPSFVLARTLGVMGFISSGTILFTIATSNPFLRILPPALNGRDLNPLLQDPGMIIHPPMLYMGYVGTSVVFSLAIAALLSGKLDSSWARWSRPWITTAWCFLTLGIALGSAWAYYELGWGGWWFWDPVENASFMPWLLGTALIHSLAVTEKRGGFKMWTALLAILTFSMSLLGTFLVRSGVITSVHAFATDPTRGIFILIFLAVLIGGSLTLFALRAPRASIGESFDTVSRDSMLLANNILLLVSAFTVLLGTLYPLILDALGLGKISVGQPYFNAVFIPLMAPALFLMGVGPITKWRSAKPIELATQLRWALAITVITSAVAALTMRSWTALIGFGLFIAIWIVTATINNLIARLRLHPQGFLTGFKIQPLSYYGMVIAHLGVAVFVFGVTMVTGFEEEKDLRMQAGSTSELAGYQIRFDGVKEVLGSNYTAAQGQITISKDGQVLTVMQPEKRKYFSSEMLMTEAAIYSKVSGDMYISMAEPVSKTEWGVKVQYKPFISWIWAGAFLIALGGFFAILDKKYRTKPAGLVKVTS